MDLKLLQEYQRLRPVGNEKQPDCVEALTAAEALQAAAQGYAPEEIYYTGSKNASIAGIFGKCRMVADSLEELRAINAIASQTLPQGQLQKVGLRMVPDGFDDRRRNGVRMTELATIAREGKKMDALSIRGCFVNGDTDGLYGKELGRYFRACYVCAKQMTVVLPCAMPYLCVENALAALACKQKQHPETLEECLTAAQIVAMQNETAFYAKLLIK